MDATPQEQWLPVVGHEGVYEVSNQGRVRSLITGKILRPAAGMRGHLHVMLARPRRTGMVHRLVAEAFHGLRPFANAEIRHVNGDASDNRAINLQYGTRSDNAKDSKRHGTHFHAGLTVCKRGHDLTDPTNLQKTVKGNERVCLACRRERQRLYDTGSQVIPDGCCINGHPKTPENRYTNGVGHTRCKPCVRQKMKV